MHVHAAPRRGDTHAARGQDLLQQPVEVLLLGAEVALVLRPEAELPVLDHLGVEVSICRTGTATSAAVHVGWGGTVR